MTSLIDVIFLLLLFFMLSSTFSRFGEVEMAVGGTHGGGAPSETMLFLSLGQADLRLNGVPLAMPDLVARVTAETEPTLLISVRDEVTAQRLTDLLITLRKTPGAQVVLLGDG